MNKNEMSKTENFSSMFAHVKTVLKQISDCSIKRSPKPLKVLFLKFVVFYFQQVFYFLICKSVMTLTNYMHG